MSQILIFYNFWLVCLIFDLFFALKRKPAGLSNKYIFFEFYNFLYTKICAVKSSIEWYKVSLNLVQRFRSYWQNEKFWKMSKIRNFCISLITWVLSVPNKILHRNTIFYSLSEKIVFIWLHNLFWKWVRNNRIFGGYNFRGLNDPYFEILWHFLMCFFLFIS